MERNQFTFYRSYLDAIRRLTKEERGEILDAICFYALDEVPPEGLSPIADTVFTLVRPTLDSGRKKAAAGKTGGSSCKQTASKAKAKLKQKPSEVEREKEVEVENECYTPHTPTGEFETFWSEYPKKVGKESARKAFERARKRVPLESLLSAIERQKCSSQWTRDNGRYIPNPTTWLNQGRWEDELPEGGDGPSGGSTGSDATGHTRSPRGRWSLKSDL